jgi:transcriptional regulator with XRE-family HTH domain
MGIHPDHRRRALAAQLRAKGLSFTAIGRRLGVSKQRAFSMVQTLNTGKLNLREPIRCRGCQAALNAKIALRRDDMKALCVGCSAGKPVAERLKALRIAAGLTQKELALAAGLQSLTVRQIKHGRCRPRRKTLEELTRVLGAL